MSVLRSQVGTETSTTEVHSLDSKQTYRPLNDDIPLTPRTNESALLGQVPILKRSLSFGSLYLPSIDFATHYTFYIYYLFILCVCRLALQLTTNLGFAHYLWPSTTILNIIHSTVTLYVMHWVRGGIGEQFASGKYERLTFWELLDGGAAYTRTKKVFTLIPVFLFLLSCYECEWRKRYYFANLVALCVSVLPKLKFMLGKRLLKLNYN